MKKRRAIGNFGRTQSLTSIVRKSLHWRGVHLSRIEKRVVSFLSVLANERLKASNQCDHLYYRFFC